VAGRAAKVGQFVYFCQVGTNKWGRHLFETIADYQALKFQLIMHFDPPAPACRVTTALAVLGGK